MAKDIKRFSYSRLKTFQTCPRKHHYTYVEQIEVEEQSTTIPGKLFHQCIEYFLKGKDMTPVFQEFSALCSRGKIEHEPDLLEYIVTKYLQHYSNEYELENTVMIEHEFEDDLEDGDKLVLIVDQAFYDTNDYLVVRDMKTTLNKLKYTQDDVMFNQQLYMYLPYVENELNHKVDAVEIDEIKLAKLQPVPLKNNGKPSVDKRLLELVTYEDYYDYLASRGLETEKEFQAILDWLQSRGHPLFRRVRCQVLDQNIIASNAQDLLDTYHSAKTQVAYRVKGPLCNYCAYKELCQLDYSYPAPAERQMLIEKISKNN
jgi:CRISPR/Cas system-associated exonuclease Cas4 (RecB family)